MGLGIEITLASAPVAVTASLSGLAKLIGLFTPSAEIVFSVKGADHEYLKKRFRWTVEERGSSTELSIRGSSAFCLAMLSYLVSLANRNGSTLGDVLLDSAEDGYDTSLVAQSYLSQLADILRGRNTVEFKWTGTDYKHTEGWFGYREEHGSKIETQIKGKPGFVKTATVYLHDNPRLMSLIVNQVGKQNSAHGLSRIPG